MNGSARQRPVFIFGLIAPVLLFFVTAGLISLVFSAAKTNAYLAQDKMQKKILERNKFIAELVADDIQESLEKCIWSVEGLAKQPALRRALEIFGCSHVGGPAQETASRSYQG